MLAHFGLGVTLLGLVCASTWGTEQIVAMKPGAVVSLRSYDLTFDTLYNHYAPATITLPHTITTMYTYHRSDGVWMLLALEYHSSTDGKLAM